MGSVVSSANQNRQKTLFSDSKEKQRKLIAEIVTHPIMELTYRFFSIMNNVADIIVKSLLTRILTI